MKGCGLKDGQWIAIVGCGGLGHLGNLLYPLHCRRHFYNISLLAIQYAKAMGFKTVGIDISNSQLDAVKALGADAVFNTLEQLDHEREIKELTSGGCHAAAVFSASNAAYEQAPKLLRYVVGTDMQTPDRKLMFSNGRVNGLLMVAGIPQQNLSINALDILLGKYRIAGKSSGIPQNMAEAIEFSHKHKIASHITTFNNIHDIHKLIDMMNSGKAAGRFGIVFK